jgi:hypothetical protein
MSCIKDEVILRLITQANYLESIRFRIDQRQSNLPYVNRPCKIPLPLFFLKKKKKKKKILSFLNLSDHLPMHSFVNDSVQTRSKPISDRPKASKTSDNGQLQQHHRLQPKRQSEAQEPAPVYLHKPVLPDREQTNSQSKAEVIVRYSKLIHQIHLMCAIYKRISYQFRKRMNLLHMKQSPRNKVTEIILKKVQKTEEAVSN